jgi:putative ABC transport system ATP-binding protein
MPLVLDGVPAAERRERARRTLESVGLGPRVGHRPSELSGGEQQRVAIARALVRGPSLLVCDEPTGNLDSATAEGVTELLLALNREHGVTIVLVTHDRDLARRCASRIVEMEDGRVVADGAVTA